MGCTAVLGAGGVGGFVAAALARAGGPVVVVTREGTPTGFSVQSVRLGDFEAHVEVVTTLREPVEFLLVATKATGLVQALERIEAEPGLVVPLLNGLDHMHTLRERFGPQRVAAGTIRIESARTAPGRILQTSPFLRIDLAGAEVALEPLAAGLERAGIPTTIGDNEAQILWSKLVRLNALALTTSAYDAPVGVIRTRHRDVLRACIHEAAAVANADGADIDPDARLAELDDAHSDLGSSMQRDIAAGLEPELDAIAGAVLRAARRHDLQCPTIARLTDEIAARAGIPAPAA